MIVHFKSATTLLALTLMAVSSAATALDVGFELSARGAFSDNVNQDNAGLEEEGQIANATISLFGGQQSRRIRSGFLGEFGGRRAFAEEDDSDFLTVTRFFGSAEFQVTRQFSWFIGDALGGSLVDNALNESDETELFSNRRNVFITGPRFQFGLGARRTLAAEFFFIDNSDDSGEDLPEFYQADIEFNSDLGAGLSWGWEIGDIFVDNPDSSIEPDFNRLTAVISGARTRNANTWSGSIGATRFEDTDGDGFAVNGFAGQLRFDRVLGAGNTFFIQLQRAVVDDTLAATESLIVDGDSRTPETAGVFNDTAFTIGQNITSGRRIINWNLGIGQDDFEAVVNDDGLFTTENAAEEDQVRVFGGANLSQPLTFNLALGLGVDYEREEFTNTEEESESLQATVSLIYSVTTSFTATFTYIHDIQEGLDIEDGIPDITDQTENRVFISLLYAPPTRALKSEVVRLKSLLF